MAEPRVVTFGCRLNAFETEVMRGLAGEAGLGDAIIINTCAVTAEAERKARQAIRRTRRQNPASRIIVTGCAAQIDPERYSGMKEVDHVLGNHDKMLAESFRRLARRDAPRDQVTDIMKIRETASHLIEGFGSRTRAFVEIQQGCDHRCTFCVIPYGRGNNRSVPAGEIAQRIRALVSAGIGEVVLTGVDITGYGTDLPGRPSLGQLCRRLLSLIPELRRLRLSSIDIAELDEDFWRMLETEPRLMPHLHLSLQSGDDLILKRMKRRHTRDQAIVFCRRARALRPGVAFGADLIAGFPTETEDMFRRTLEMIAEADLTYTHVFRYSARKGTPAARMPQVPTGLREERGRRLRQAGDAALADFFARSRGTEIRLLVEEIKDSEARGHSDEFAPVRLGASAARPGQVVQARVTGHCHDHLIAEAL